MPSCDNITENAYLEVRIVIYYTITSPQMSWTKFNVALLEFVLRLEALLAHSLPHVGTTPTQIICQLHILEIEILLELEGDETAILLHLMHGYSMAKRVIWNNPKTNDQTSWTPLELTTELDVHYVTYHVGKHMISRGTS